MSSNFTNLKQIITGTGTFSGSVAAGDSKAYTFSAPGAKAGKPVTGDPASDISPLSVSSRVANADSVTITLKNTDLINSHDPTGVNISFVVFNA